MSETTSPRSRENTRARLLTAASEVFAESGFDGASVEAICERAGFTRGAFYSNFASKEELFFELMRQVSDAKLERVSTRVRELESEGIPALTPAELVLRVLDIEHEERLDVVLMSEIRTNAMRDGRLAQAFLEWEEAMLQRVAQIIADLARTYSLRLRMPVEDAARFVLQNWDATCGHAVMAGLSPTEALRLVSERTAALASAIAD